MSHPPVRKAVILIAGLGSRFLPMTKAVPKAMLPIVDKPVVQYLVEEAAASGITDIMIVRSPSQELVEDHFKANPILEEELQARGRTEALKKVQSIAEGVNIEFTIQVHALGDGHALLHAKDFVGDEPFAVLFGDEIIKSDTPALKQLLNLYANTGTPVIGCTQIPTEHIHAYGVIAPAKIEGRALSVKSLVEKPAAKDAPSSYGIIGKYICTPDVLTYIKDSQASHSDGEMRLIDGFLSQLNDKKPLHAYEVEGERFDTGNQKGLLQANIAFGEGMNE